LLRGASACPCSDDPGSGAFLTRADQSYALALTSTTRRAMGTFDVAGHYRALGPGELEASEELLLRAALRLPERLEWQAELGAASYRFHTPTFDQEQRSVGDGVLHARYALRQEDMSHAGARWPAISLGVLSRAPLGALVSSRSGGFGSSGAQLGLGAWEVAANADVSRQLAPRLGFSFGAELGYRLPDRALGRERQLGPRLDLSLSADVEAADWLSATVAIGSRFTGDVELDERELDGTGERSLSTTLAVTVRQRPSGLRSSLGLRFEPPVTGLARSSVATLALSSTLGVAF
jgi:hypothetical protein